MPAASAVEKVLQAFSSQQSVIDKAMSAIYTPSIVDKALRIFSESSNLMRADSGCFLAMAESISVLDFSVDFIVDESDFDLPHQEILEAKNTSEFAKIFPRLSPNVQALLFFMFMQILLPQINNITANLLTPIVQSYIVGNGANEKASVRLAKKLPSLVCNVATYNLRFILENNVYLRQAPSRKSAILDKFTIGQVVTVLSRKRDWIQVMYEYQEGEAIVGWVSTRYTARFVK